MTESLSADSILIQGKGEAVSIVEGIDFTQMLIDFRNELAKDESTDFANQSAPDGQAWAPLTKTTQQRKGGNPILVKTGALRESLVDVDGTDNAEEVTSHELVYGTAIDYATFHETGTKYLPARPMIGMSTETLNQLATRIADATASATAPKIADAIGDAVIEVVVERNTASGRRL